MRLHHEGLMIRVQCQLMICRGHIRTSKGAFKIFLWLMVVCENGHFSQILHFVFILAAISMGRKWVRRSKILSGFNLNMVQWDPVQKQENLQFGIGHPPTYISIAVYMCGGGFKGPKSSNGIQLSRFVQKLWHF